ncbi:MAG: hypothetical protein H6738_11875 [Alphaproteobacteria bacterium]|nr:hypothetical protein [Alphaproteobacteria bacterium]MCB9697470.1 hypothetical protein [Alphaproteobacteria bacterium]
MTPDAAVLVGLGTAGAGDDPAPFLSSPKEAKYLGLQDRLGVVAAGRAAAGLALDPDRTGLFLAVGHLPFDPPDIDRVLAASLDEDGDFSLPRFTSVGWTRARPLLAFRCLPNVVAYHIASALGIRGPCSVGYPGPGQLHAALEEAVDALAEGLVDHAVVGGIAAQRNWLVEHHHARLVPPVPADTLVEAAGVMVLARSADAPLARLVGMHATFEPSPSVAWEEPGGDGLRRGPAALPVALATRALPLRHEVRGPDGVRCATTWEVA